MSEFEDKLNKILSSPEDLEKIAGLARTLSSGGAAADGAPGGGDSEAAPSGGAAELGGLAGALSGLDPKMLGLVGRLMREYSSGGNDKSELIHALRPYLREDRREKIDKAAEIAKLARLAKVAFGEFSGGDHV
jgi:hypothetical protein